VHVQVSDTHRDFFSLFPAHKENQSWRVVVPDMVVDRDICASMDTNPATNEVQGTKSEVSEKRKVGTKSCRKKRTFVYKRFIKECLKEKQIQKELCLLKCVAPKVSRI